MQIAAVPAFLTGLHLLVTSYYSCVEILAHFSIEGSCSNQGQKQCVGVGDDEFFYRDLPHVTTDDLEVRVCRGEIHLNEDISISLLEIYVQ